MAKIQEDIKPLWTKEILEAIGKEYTPEYEERKINTTYDQLNEQYPIDGQEWTYSQPEEIDGKQYYVFGFDTMHYGQNESNWPESRVVYCIENYVEVVNK